MTRKNDPRPDRSRQTMIAAILEMLERRDLGQITAAEVATAAGVSRSTFYEHFSGLDALAASACTQLFDDLLAAAGGEGIDGPGELPVRLEVFFEHVRANRRLYSAVLGPNGSASVSAYLHRSLTSAILVADSRTASPLHVGGKRNGLMSETRAAFFAGGLVATATSWLERETDQTPAQLAAEVSRIVLAANLGQAAGAGLSPLGEPPAAAVPR
ncbi:MAG: TetR/AcrR family transcriptional regulator [Microbacterium sp.]|uniref:TetR/AcrR family transcriptional regulator n=1 Tax=Microbacterium sp. TaxID=51671 RepID=UPI0027168AB8|nr:TetR/AcrR family transcriptional regulator [Microbacterium sp.]MDO8382477.1 TetR/AcrR family transcriptional regulator [Microbacterium sp.]